jgi:hypothetical protein
MKRLHALAAFGLAVLTTLLLAIGHRDVGYVRDEGIYFEASRRYAAWVSHVATGPGHVSDRKLRDRAFSVNHEHPVLLKTLAGLSARTFAEPPVAERGEDRGGRLPVMPEGAAMRLPAQVLAGVGVGLLYLIGLAWAGPWAGLLAAGGFILLPRVAFHAGLHAFDVPIAVATLIVVMAYRRSQASARWGLALGPLLGLAIATKHNALFLGPLLALHYWACLAWGHFRHGRPVARGQWFPLPLASMAVLSPLVAWALWPWMWSDTVTRLTEYVAFHGQHSWYNTEFLGHNYNQPPMPFSYPWVMTWATVPTALLLLAAVGLATRVVADVTARSVEADGGSFRVPLPRGWARFDGALLAMMTLFPIALIALPNTPIFGGTKHWLTAYPFLALAAALGLDVVCSRAALGARRRFVLPLAVLVVLGPTAIATGRGHPHNLSQYAPLVGGPRGAADLGLQRGFWGYDVRGLLPTVTQQSSIYLHDIHELARRQYVREGVWPPGLLPAPAARAPAGLLFHERHMAIYEFELWEAMGTTAPAEVESLHDVPTTSLYLRP